MTGGGERRVLLETLEIGAVVLWAGSRARCGGSATGDRDGDREGDEQDRLPHVPPFGARRVAYLKCIERGGSGRERTSSRTPGASPRPSSALASARSSAV